MELSTYLISATITWHKVVAAIVVIAVIVAGVVFFTRRTRTA
ncbi:MAG TPA: hypothetical protein VFD01_18060 [Candidatus Dormibacteraeota bacterium]|jgi:hypothetical protein|nr:hypothetical protein [Candidatus Dormibacteraeota bacterium]